MDLNYVNQQFLIRGYILLETEYKNVQTKMSYLCLRHRAFGIQSINYNQLQQGQECKYCQIDKTGKPRTHELDYVKYMFNKKDSILLEEKYINTTTRMKYICKKHPKIIQETTFANLLDSVYGCPLCSYEKFGDSRRLRFDDVKKIFENYNLILLDKEYINNATKMKYICRSHPDIIQETTFTNLIIREHNCSHCFLDSISGGKHWNWKGGITPLYYYLKNNIYEWKFDSMKQYNFKCIFTGKKFDAIHHLYSFNKIMKETMDKSNLPIFEEISQYTENELKLLKDICLKLHYQYGLGVPLINDVHKLYHHHYDYGNNTPEQFEEFIVRYYNGEFNTSIEKG